MRGSLLIAAGRVSIESIGLQQSGAVRAQGGCCRGSKPSSAGGALGAGRCKG